ncbi:MULTISPECIES: alpha/beta hydrolase [unclassified Pseudomonas]|uniref:alpha/beta hydrolase n=1 Tax=unclassified Pseudomonas TaxID=196821 RepID=UPI0009F3ADEC|nr:MULTISPECIES: alpha/beta hydrolase [unclassified Pseudomonas]QIH07996.1 alpha/beta hydrolase [Pseudomonas sp. BIOMIG1BAC]
MAPLLWRLLKQAGLVLGIAGVTLLAWRAYDSAAGPALQPWHLHVPHELDAEQLDRADWATWLKAEERVFAEVEQQVSATLDPAQVPAFNRYRQDSRTYPPAFATNWNHSYILRPKGRPQGVVVLVHGLTDSPYSLRHVARRYVEHGYLAIGLRLPGHGTVPAGLTDARWQDWLAATRMALRTARQEVPAPAPLHIVGYSNGGALAVKYALDALADPRLPQAQRLVLISPMIGVAASARFAGLAAWPAVFPAFSKAAWLNLRPEYNPFKYNSFPVNGARQSWLLTDALQSQLLALAEDPRLANLPPILSFQSLTDATVSTRALVDGLYQRLPANGSELVIFDLNRARDFEGLLDPASVTSLAGLLPPPPRRYTTQVLTNDGSASMAMELQTTTAVSEHSTRQPLDLAYPPEVFSLSHVALPFPLDDALYGTQPSTAEDFGVHLGTVAARGERGVLVVPMDELMRLTANPFFPYLIQRIEADIDHATVSALIR